MFDVRRDTASNRERRSFVSRRPVVEYVETLNEIILSLTSPRTRARDACSPIPCSYTFARSKLLSVAPSYARSVEYPVSPATSTSSPPWRRSRSSPKLILLVASNSSSESRPRVHFLSTTVRLRCHPQRSRSVARRPALATTAAFRSSQSLSRAQYFCFITRARVRIARHARELCYNARFHDTRARNHPRDLSPLRSHRDRLVSVVPPRRRRARRSRRSSSSIERSRDVGNAMEKQTRKRAIVERGRTLRRRVAH